MLSLPVHVIPLGANLVWDDSRMALWLKPGLLVRSPGYLAAENMVPIKQVKRTIYLFNVLQTAHLPSLRVSVFSVSGYQYPAIIRVRVRMFKRYLLSTTVSQLPWSDHLWRVCLLPPLGVYLTSTYNGPCTGALGLWREVEMLVLAELLAGGEKQTCAGL